jgi:hypothetical protein
MIQVRADPIVFLSGNGVCTMMNNLLRGYFTDCKDIKK